MAIPQTVDREAQTVFLLTPPSMVKDTMVTYVQIRNTVSRVGKPFISIGRSSQNRQISVIIRPTSDLAPVFPPTRTVATTNREITAARARVLLYS